MRRVRLVGAAIAMGLVVPGGCGEDSQPLVGPPPPPGKPAALVGTWEAVQPGGYRLRYVFRPDTTYAHVQGNRQQRKRGTYRYAITARGRWTARGRTLVLRPRSGTIERHDPDDPDGDFKRSLDKRAQRYEWSLRGAGEEARLTLTIGGALAVTYRRR